MPHAARPTWAAPRWARLRQIWLFRERNRFDYPHLKLASAEWAVVNLGITSEMVEHLGAAIAAAPFAPNLRRLEVVSRSEHPNCWLPLRRTKRLKSLTRFAFRTRDNLPRELRLADLTSAPWFAGLERLELAGKGYLDAPLVVPDLRDLLQPPRLRALVLERCRLPTASANRLRALPAVALEHLDLGPGCEIGKKALRALIYSPGMGRLRSFGLSGNGNAALSYLSDAPLREALRSLRLSGCQPSGLLRLARAGCPQLARFAVRISAAPHERAFIESAVRSLLEPQAFPRLVRLTITTSDALAADVVRTVARHPGSARLKELVLDLTSSRDDARALAESPWLGGLTRLAHSCFGPEWDITAAILRQRFGSRFEMTRTFGGV